MKTVSVDGRKIRVPDDATLEEIDALSVPQLRETPSFMERMGNRALAAAPGVGGFVGGIAGGIIGAPAAGVGAFPGAIAGAGVGGAVGEGIREAGSGHNLDPGKIALGGLEQGAYEVGGGLIAKGASMAARPIMKGAIRASKSIQRAFPDVVETALSRGLSASKGGLEKASRLRGESAGKTAALLKKAKAGGTKFNPNNVVASVNEALMNPALPARDAAVIRKQLQNFLDQYRETDLLYHGSDAVGSKAIERQGFLGGGPRDTWMTPDRRVAESYASEKGGKVFAVRKSSMDPSLLLPDEESAWRTPGAIGVGRDIKIPLTLEGIDPVLLQEIKQIYQTRSVPGYAADAAGKKAAGMSPIGQFNKGIASGARKQLHTIPGVAAQDAETQNLIGAERAIRDATMRHHGRLEIMKPGTYPIVGALGSPAITSTFARLLNSSAFKKIARQSPRLASELMKQAMYSDRPDASSAGQ